MTSLDALLLAFCLIATSLHLITTALAMWRCRAPRETLPAPADAPAVTILRPICGVDNFDEATLRSGFELDYPDYDLVFCCEDAADPSAALVRDLMVRYPGVRARLLIGRDAISANPKLNNLVKGWPHVRGDWLVFADSNVLMPPDYVQRLLAGWKADTGVLCAPPIGSLPAGFWSELECAFLNTYQAEPRQVPCFFCYEINVLTRFCDRLPPNRGTVRVPPNAPFAQIISRSRHRSPPFTTQNLSCRSRRSRRTFEWISDVSGGVLPICA